MGWIADIPLRTTAITIGEIRSLVDGITTMSAVIDEKLPSCPSVWLMVFVRVAEAKQFTVPLGLREAEALFGAPANATVACIRGGFRLLSADFAGPGSPPAPRRPA